jgi:hypothetical protein
LFPFLDQQKTAIVPVAAEEEVLEKVRKGSRREGGTSEAVYGKLSFGDAI